MYTYVDVALNQQFENPIPNFETFSGKKLHLNSIACQCRKEDLEG